MHMPRLHPSNRLIRIWQACHLCTYQALGGLHPRKEKSSPSSCLYEFEESVHDHFHQEGLSQFELPDVPAYKQEKDKN